MGTFCSLLSVHVKLCVLEYLTMPYTDLPARNSGRSSARAPDHRDRYESTDSANSESTLEKSSYDSSSRSSHYQPYPIRRPADVYSPRPADSSSPSLDQFKFAPSRPDSEGLRRRETVRKRLNSADEEHTFFSHIRDTDADNDWDDLDEVDLHQDEDGNGQFNDMLYEQVVEPDDPAITGAHKQWQEDYEDVEKQMVREMSYKQRRKALSRIKIEYNISCKLNDCIFTQPS